MARPRHRLASRHLLGAALLVAASQLRGADIFHSNTPDAANLTTAWTGGVVPGSGDVAVWDSTVTAANTTALGASLTWGGIRIANPAGTVTISNTAGATLSLGSGGIDMSAATQNLTLGANLALVANQTWTVAGGRTLTGIAGASTSSGSGTGNLSLQQSGTGVALVVFNQNGNAGSGQTGWSSYSGNLTIGPNVKVQSQGNAAIALGSGTVTLAGGALHQNSGTWTFGNNFNVTAASVIGNDSSSGLGRSLKLLGQLTSSNGSALTFTNTTTGGTRTQDVGFILAGSGASTYGDTIVSDNSRVRVGGNATATVAGDGYNAGNRGSLGTGTVTLSGSNSELALTRTDTHTVANAISGAGTLVIGGTTAALAATTSQVVVLTGSNSYSGTTTIASGTLQVGSGGTAGTLGSGAVTNNGSLVFNRSDSLTVSNVISGTGSVSMQGAGTLVLGGANTFSGGAVLGAGTLQVNQATGLGSGALIVNGGALTTAANQVTLTNALTLNAVVSFTGTAGTQGMRLDGLISGSGGFSKDGTGRVTLTNNSNSFSGGVTINDGILAVTNSALSSAGSVNILGPTAGGLALGINGTTVINNLSGGANGRIRTDFNITGGDGARTLHVIQSVDGEFAGQTLHSATRVLTLLKSGAATLTLSGSNAHQGGTIIRQGTIVANNASGLGAAGTVTLNDASTGASNTTLRLGSVSVARAITVANQGTGVTTLGANGSVATPEFSGAITLAKAVTLDGSTVTDRLTFSGGIGGTGDVTIAGTGRVVFNTTANTYAGATIVSAGSILQLGLGGSSAIDLIPDASVVDLGSASFLKLAKLSNNETIGGLTGTGTVRGHEAVASAASSLTISNTGTHSFGGVLENGGASGSTLALVKSGSGTQVLTGANTFTGGVTVTAGTLALSGSGTLGAGTVTVTGGTLDLGGVASAASIVLNGGSLAGAGAYAGALSVSGNSAISGAIGGTFGSGTAGTEVVTVAAGTSFTGTLKGIGTLSGDVTLAANSIHAPGNSPGVQTVTGDLTYANQSTVQWELIANSEAGRGTSFDGIDVGGDLTLGSAPNGVTLSLVFAGTVDWADAFWAANRSWLLYDVAGTTAGFSNLQITSSLLDASGDLLTNVRSQASFGLQQVGNDIRITYTAVPEPSTYGLALGALALAGAALRRRRKG